MATKKKEKKRHIMRLLPMTVTMLSLLFVVKINEVYIGSKSLREVYGARDAVAEDKKSEEHKPEEKKKPAKEEVAKANDAEKKSADAKPEEEKKTESHAEAKTEGHAEAKAEGEHGEKAAEEGEHGASKPAEEPRTHGTGKSTIKDIEEMKARELQPRYSPTEMGLLQSLSKRRDELDQRERDLEIKAKVLEATDKRIADKMSEMKTMQAELSGVLSQYNEKQDAQIKSLVKIYESMKPDEAAAIFNEMEMPILLEVIGKMSERKVAPVLANMSPKKARDVTQELAEKRKKSVLSGAGSASAALPTKP